VTSLLARFLIPHSHNNHYPHSIRPIAIACYLALIIAVQLIYNFTRTGEVRVLSYATDINQAAIISLSNTQRQAHGQTTLKESNTLDQVAALKAADMFKYDYWAHVSPSGVTPWFWYDQIGYKYIYAGENLARNFDTNNSVVDAWMNSSGHRENLLSPNYTEIGVAVVNGTLLGHETTLIVQEFGKPQAPTIGQESPTKPSSTNVGVAISSELQPTSPPASEKAPRPVSLNPYLATPLSEIDSKPAVLGLQNLGVGQILLLIMLIPIVAFFAFDAFELIRRRQVVFRGHSLTHAAILGLMLVVVVTASFGVLR
jgi:uncharacterized protein YkwD